MIQNVVLHLGESGDSFAQRIGRHVVKTDKQPAGMNFYDIDWTVNRSEPGVVTFEHGEHTFTIDAVLGVMGSSYEPDINKWGIIDFNISFGITKPDLIAHDEARLKVMALLRMLQDKGWRQYYLRDAARVKGRSALFDGFLDVRYEPSFEEWMTLKDGAKWFLEADGVYLSMQMWRDDKHLNPQQPGAYFMTMELHGEEDDVRRYFLEPDRNNWRELWPERMKKSNEFRTEAEAEARAKGYQIDTDYQDPPIKALIKPELSSKVGQPCPKDGIWEASRSDSMAAALASYPARWRRFKQGEVMTGFGQGLPGFDDDNQHITWTWRKPLES